MDYCAGYVSSVSQRSWIGQEGIMYGADVPQLGDRSGTEFSAPHAFDGMQTPSFYPTLQGRVLNVVIHQVKHSVPIDVLNHLFSSYGVVEKIFLSSNQHGRTILIQYQHDYMADNALRATHGWYLYGTYCQLVIRHAYPADLQILYDYSCAFLSEINTSEQKLTHEVAMHKVEAIDDLYSVNPHLKGQISEQQPHVIQELLAQIQANLANISENMSQDLKRMKQSGERAWDCSTQTAASQPNLPNHDTLDKFNMMPIYDVCDEEPDISLNGVANVLDCALKQQQYEDDNAIIELEKFQDGDQLSRGKPEGGMLAMCCSKASETISLEVPTEFAFSDHPMDFLPRSSKLTNEKNTLSDSMPLYDYDYENSAYPDVSNCALEQHPQQADDNTSENVHQLRQQLTAKWKFLMLEEFKGSGKMSNTSKELDLRERLSPPLILLPCSVLCCTTVLTNDVMGITQGFQCLLQFDKIPCSSISPTEPPDTKANSAQDDISDAYYTQKFSTEYCEATSLLLIEVKSPCLQTVVQCSNSKLIKQLLNYSCMVNWSEDIFFAISKPTTQSDAMIMVKYSSTYLHIWDPGIALQLYQKPQILPWCQWAAIDPVQQQLQGKRIFSLWEYSFEKDAQMQWDPGKDNKKFNDPIPELCSSRFNSIHYCQIFQKFNAMNPEHYSQQNMNLFGIALWLINFQPP